MTTSVSLRGWSRRRWGTVILVFFLLQLGLIWRFSARMPLPVASPPPGPRVILLNTAPEAINANVSPLFLNHVTREGFSGRLWLESPPLQQPSLATKTPPGWLTLNNDVFRTSLSELVQRLAPPSAPRLRFSEPEIARSGALPKAPVINQPSRLLVAGDLAALDPRELPILPPQTNETLLKPTVLDVGVDAQGRVLAMRMANRTEIRSDSGASPAGNRTFVPELARSGSEATDAFAMETAMRLRFQPRAPEPLVGVPEALTWGQLIFEWQTVAPASTNTPPQSP